MKYAFISYDARDKSAADAIRKTFNEHGMSTWMAPYDVPYGKQYSEVVKRAVKGCTCFVVVLSNSAQSSPNVENELDCAVSNHKETVFLQLERVNLLGDFKLFVPISPTISLSSFDRNSVPMQNAINTVARSLGVTPRFTGRGEYGNSAGTHYTGDFVRDKFHGGGEISIGNGDRYRGDFVRGVPHGRGEYFWADGSRYIGEFKNGDFHGHGEWFLASGDHYVGDFKNNLYDGRGELFIAGGDRYVGEFKDGNFHGSGEYFFAEGGKFTGTFKHGDTYRGIFYDAQGRVASVK